MHAKPKHVSATLWSTSNYDLCLYGSEGSFYWAAKLGIEFDSKTYHHLETFILVCSAYLIYFLIIILTIEYTNGSALIWTIEIYKNSQIIKDLKVKLII